MNTQEISVDIDAYAELLDSLQEDVNTELPDPMGRWTPETTLDSLGSFYEVLENIQDTMAKYQQLCQTGIENFRNIMEAMQRQDAFLSTFLPPRHQPPYTKNRMKHHHDFSYPLQ